MHEKDTINVALIKKFWLIWHCKHILLLKNMPFERMRIRNLYNKFISVCVRMYIKDKCWANKCIFFQYFTAIQRSRVRILVHKYSSTRDLAIIWGLMISIKIVCMYKKWILQVLRSCKDELQVDVSSLKQLTIIGREKKTAGHVTRMNGERGN